MPEPAQQRSCPGMGALGVWHRCVVPWLPLPPEALCRAVVAVCCDYIWGLGYAGGQVPAATVDLFVRLLEALDRGQSEDALRPHLYAALLSFMQYSQGRRPAQASPHILSTLLKSGTHPSTHPLDPAIPLPPPRSLLVPSQWCQSRFPVTRNSAFQDAVMSSALCAWWTCAR